MKGFTTPWENYSKCFEIQIYSKTIQTLKLQYCKIYELSAIDAEQLKEIQIESDYWCFCLYHAQSSVDESGSLYDDPEDPPGRLAGILARGCPNLERYNGMDLKSLARNGSWLEELQSHKGEGLYSEQSRCAMCRYRGREALVGGF